MEVNAKANHSQGADRNAINDDERTALMKEAGSRFHP